MKEENKKELSKATKKNVQDLNEEELLKLEELEKSEGGGNSEVCAVACLWSQLKVISSGPESLEENDER